jgi:GntR family transcriptional regulator, transcriptional repressor for pyruvate dehydrogenase complex
MRRLEPSAAYIERTGHVIAWLCSRAQDGTLRPGDQIGSAAELADAVKVGGQHVRSAIACLCTLGVLRVEPDAGIVLAEDPPELLLKLLAALCASRPRAVTEARHVLETELAGLAAERASQDDHTAMAEEVAGMYAATAAGDHLDHAVRLHRAIARATGNSILAAFAEALMISGPVESDESSEEHLDLRESAHVHAELYRAIRRHLPAEAKKAMAEHGHLAFRSGPYMSCREEVETAPRTTGT